MDLAKAVGAILVKASINLGLNQGLAQAFHLFLSERYEDAV